MFEIVPEFGEGINPQNLAKLEALAKAVKRIVKGIDSLNHICAKLAHDQKITIKICTDKDPCLHGAQSFTDYKSGTINVSENLGKTPLAFLKHFTFELFSAEALHNIKASSYDTAEAYGAACHEAQLQALKVATSTLSDLVSASVERTAKYLQMLGTTEAALKDELPELDSINMAAVDHFGCASQDFYISQWTADHNVTDGVGALGVS